MSSKAERGEQSAEFVGRSAQFFETSARIERASRLERATLVLGPTGAGKDVVARELHARSSRSSRPFVTVHCAALPETLAEAELFGFTRGAFTGAMQSRAGLVRTAADGTLFLDEVDSLSPASQARLLRFLDSGEYRPVGADRAERSGAWVIAATNRDLRDAVQRGAFREDLYFRLAAVQITVPPLRERPDDIVPLAEHFLARSTNHRCALSSDARASLRSYAWPGNVRELRHRVESAGILSGGREVTARMLDLEAPSSAPPSSAPPSSAPPPPEPRDLRDLLWEMVTDGRHSFAHVITICEQSLIRAALDAEANNRTRAAGRLGIHVRTIYKKLDGAREQPDACPDGHTMPDRAACSNAPAV